MCGGVWCGVCLWCGCFVCGVSVRVCGAVCVYGGEVLVYVLFVCLWCVCEGCGVCLVCVYVYGVVWCKCVMWVCFFCLACV